MQQLDNMHPFLDICFCHFMYAIYLFISENRKSEENKRIDDEL